MSINARATIYETFTVPTKTGYTPIGISVTGTGGGGSGYIVVVPLLDGGAMIYNGTDSNLSGLSAVLKIIYLKNN